MPLAAQDKAAEVMAAGAGRRSAAPSSTQVKALSLEGPFAREMGSGRCKGTIVIDAAAARTTCIAAKTPS